MKLRVTLKDPDGFYEGVRAGVKDEVRKIEGLSEHEQDWIIQQRQDNVWEDLTKFVSGSEYVTIEFDTDTGTATVLER